MDLSGPGIDVKLKERKKEERHLIFNAIITSIKDDVLHVRLLKYKKTHVQGTSSSF
jgi:hypothetical protein